MSASRRCDRGETPAALCGAGGRPGQPLAAGVRGRPRAGARLPDTRGRPDGAVARAHRPPAYLTADHWRGCGAGPGERRRPVRRRGRSAAPDRPWEQCVRCPSSSNWSTGRGRSGSTGSIAVTTHSAPKAPSAIGARGHRRLPRRPHQRAAPVRHTREQRHVQPSCSSAPVGALQRVGTGLCPWSALAGCSEDTLE